MQMQLGGSFGRCLSESIPTAEEAACTRSRPHTRCLKASSLLARRVRSRHPSDRRRRRQLALMMKTEELIVLISREAIV